MSKATSLISRIGKLKEFLISDDLRSDEEVYRKASILAWVCVGVILLCSAVTMADLVVGNTKFLGIFVMLVTLLGGILAGLKKGWNPSVLSNILMATCFSAIMYSMLERGGVLSAQLVFLILIPPLMVSISGIRSAVVWALASCAAICYFVFLQWGPEPLTVKFGDEYFSNAFANYVSAVLFVTWMFAYTEYSRREARKGMLIEQERSDKLLLNILPEKAAIELKETGRYQAQDYESVTVLFTDFSGFTEISGQMEPQELVGELDSCFTEFDRICQARGLEKIKTIGDSYMAVCGLPEIRTDHAKQAAIAAIEMCEALKKLAPLAVHAKDGSAYRFKMRIGLHSGPVVAGVVGSTKFQYDIWGDTVNTASRMESAGEVGKVNISQSTYKLLKDLPAEQAGGGQFAFQSRGKVEAKGKGELEMYFVERDES